MPDDTIGGESMDPTDICDGCGEMRVDCPCDTSVRALAKKHGIDLRRVNKHDDEFELETGKPFLSDLIGD